MAGRGSRFATIGESLPKPLIELAGRPFFWWATESLLRAACEPVVLNFVILHEHAEEFGLDRKIRTYFPAAKIFQVPDVTPGALATACVALPTIADDAPVIINDCDHAFRSKLLPQMLEGCRTGAMDGFLCHFQSSSPAYSYAEYGPAGELRRTVEKQTISDLAIAGAYGFASARILNHHVSGYRDACGYAELFVSGVYNTMLEDGGTVRGLILDKHVSFGVPAEMEAARSSIGDLF